MNNLVTVENQRIPSYGLNKSKRTIECYLQFDGELRIVGRLDNNYIYWYSSSHIEYERLNKEVFEYLTTMPIEYVTSLYSVSDGKEETAHKFSLDLSSIEKMKWSTPFGHYYAYENEERHGEYFARDLSSYYRTLQKKCEIREAEGLYLRILKVYLDKLSEKETNYPKVKNLEEILKIESYLLVSKNPEIRKYYGLCIEKIKSLYNAYMTMIR